MTEEQQQGKKVIVEYMVSSDTQLDETVARDLIQTNAPSGFIVQAVQIQDRSAQES